MGTTDHVRQTDSTSDHLSHAPKQNHPFSEEPREKKWQRFNRADWMAVSLLCGIVLVVTIPRLTPGVCYGDSGEFQLGSAVAGIIHPPGYAGYVSLGYLITRIPGVDPAYCITLACLGTGLISLWFCFAFQIRLGVNRWLAVSTCLMLTAHHRVWSDLLFPEVYMPSLALLAACAYMMTKYAHLGVRRDFYISAFLYGFVLSNRPPILFALPFFLVAWWLARKRWEPNLRRSAITFIFGTVTIALPLVYSFTFYWIRDTQHAPLNYIRQYNEYTHVLPNLQNDWRVKFERVIWLMSAKQYRYKFGNNWAGIRSKIHWLKDKLLFGQPKVLALIIVIILLGIIILYKRERIAAWLLMGMGIQSLIFICAYRIHGQAANILPLLFSMTVFFGISATIALSKFPIHQHKIACGTAILVCIWTFMDVPQRSNIAKTYNALPFLRELDIDTLPRNAVICTNWRLEMPMKYAQYIHTQRSDLNIIATKADMWDEVATHMAGKPVFAVHPSSHLKKYVAIPYRNIWQLNPNQAIKD